MAGGDWRREPKLGADPGRRTLRADPDDRIGAKPRGRRKGERIEPRFEDRSAPALDVGDDERGRMAGRGGSKGRAKRAAAPQEPEAEAPAPRRRGGGGRGRRGGRGRGRSLARLVVYWCLVLGVWGAIGTAGIVAYYAFQLPPIDQLAVPKRPPNIAIIGDDGTLIANRGDTGGPAIHLRELPRYLPKAFVAIEDRRFYSHWGIDPIGILRAAFRNLVSRGGNIQGGSTLTQQLAKNLFLTQERTLSRKIQEAILALWLEHKYTKNQILELYLNRVYFGSGAYGVEAASEKYFGHSARQATLSEAAMLAGLMKAPTKLAPNHNLAGAIDRSAKVIAAMLDEGYITKGMAQAALANPPKIVRDPGSTAMNYAADYVMDELAQTVGAIDQDIVVTTTIDPRLQSKAGDILKGVLDKDGAHWRVDQGALVALSPEGAVKALVGGRDYGDSQFNRAIAAHRQPGSSFKPFVYLTALEHGLTPDTIREDGPISIHGWKPENASRRYYGPVTLTTALSMSLNTVSVRLALEFGPKAIIATAHRLGITSDLQPNASIALGTSEVTPLEMAVGYAPFANGGIRVRPHVIQRVRTTRGHVLYQRKDTSYGRVVDPAYVGMMNAMLQQTLITGTARGAELPGWQAAGKTGTTQDYRDAWFVGYTSHLVTAVWLGNDDSSPTRNVSGANLPVRIWKRFMEEAHRGVPVEPLPGNWREPGPWSPTAPPANIPMTGPGEAARTLPPGRIPVRAYDPMPAGSIGGAPRTAEAGRGANNLVPPGSIPDGRLRPARGRPGRQPNFFERLFGG